MYNVGDIITRVKNPYKYVHVGIRGEIVEHIGTTVERVLILEGGNKGEEHQWAHNYVELATPFTTTPDWEV